MLNRTGFFSAGTGTGEALGTAMFTERPSPTATVMDVHEKEVSPPREGGEEKTELGHLRSTVREHESHLRSQESHLASQSSKVLEVSESEGSLVSDT